jgi:penicillin-binding protein
LTAAKSAEGVSISFQASPSADVVGYRLYRSDNRAPYHLLAGKVALTGGELKLTDAPPAGTAVVYAVKAVDVAGKESATSVPVSPYGAIDPLFLPPAQPGSGDTAVPGSTVTGQPAGGSVPPGPPAKTPPAAPVSLALKEAPISGLSLTWKPGNAQDRIIGYNVYFSDTEKGTYKKLGTAPVGSAEFRYYALTYDGYYKVAAYNEAGESQPTAPVEYKKPQH